MSSLPATPTTSSTPPSETLKRLREEQARRLRDGARHRHAATGYAHYLAKPVPFIETILGDRPWSIQATIANAVRDNPNVAVPSCFGSGKDWIAARIGIWWVATGGILVATSNSFPQLRDIFWRELRRAHKDTLLPGMPSNGTDLRWEVGDAWAIGRKPDDNDPEGLQGVHGSRVLVIVDEANGVGAPLWEATNGLVVNEASRRLAIGNPFEPIGPFYEACKSPTWTVIPISVFDTPNFTGEPVPEKAQAELVSPFWLDQRKAEGLEGTPWWQAKVLGQFPDTASNAVIPLSWVETARARDHVPDHREWAGLDVARFGSDDSALVEGSGNGPERSEVVHGQDTMAVAGLGMRYLNARRGTLAVDVIGVGGGVVDRIKEQKPPGVLLSVNVAETPDHDPDLLSNLRSQLWWDARLAFAPEASDPVSLARLSPEDYTRLRSELTAPTYRMTSTGKVQIESKEELKARGLPSPDLADAFNLALYARARSRRRTSSFGAVA